MKFFIALLILTAIFALAIEGSEASWDGRKFCTNVVCKKGLGDGFCMEECTPRGWTNGQCLNLPGTGDTSYCCCWTP
ncbi:hypothetical protein L1987_23659 [Smallanthus sonchifolius]|uniref:Uncharacterized protein n=1 Tax=Smallanthus sonchifolius TaxID=185202 RepID=A0ACB9IK14_9ASTR|nr:hypothetical protein L1987_23659 [Smallanthus sonchifolius]